MGFRSFMELPSILGIVHLVHLVPGGLRVVQFFGIFPVSCFKYITSIQWSISSVILEFTLF